mmetsp:Transcript_23040/g.50682  ORF Transcript_23040/g.50682 Transcript_23040/m.50682 type:complete len:214 (+) Transcript_23040:342-983(+)
MRAILACFFFRTRTPPRGLRARSWLPSWHHSQTTPNRHWWSASWWYAQGAQRDTPCSMDPMERPGGTESTSIMLKEWGRDWGPMERSPRWISVLVELWVLAVEPTGGVPDPLPDLPPLLPPSDSEERPLVRDKELAEPPASRASPELPSELAVHPIVSTVDDVTAALKSFQKTCRPASWMKATLSGLAAPAPMQERVPRGGCRANTLGQYRSH